MTRGWSGLLFAVACSAGGEDSERPDTGTSTGGMQVVTPAAGGADISTGGSTGGGASDGGASDGGAGNDGGVQSGSGGISTGGASSAGGTLAGTGGSLPSCGATMHLARCEEYTRHICPICNPGGCDESQICYALGNCDALYSDCPSHFECALAATTCDAIQACAPCEIAP